MTFCSISSARFHKHTGTTGTTLPTSATSSPKMSTTAPPIRLLPESVSARIRSTLTITNISDVTSELLQNAIDAGARNVAITVNLGRNSCVLEDDGHGITPGDMLLVGREYGNYLDFFRIQILFRSNR